MFLKECSPNMCHLKIPITGSSFKTAPSAAQSSEPTAFAWNDPQSPPTQPPPPTPSMSVCCKQLQQTLSTQTG